MLRGGCDSSCARGRRRTRRGRERERESESCSRGRKQRVGAGIDISTRETFLPLAGLRRFKVLFFSVPSLSFFLSPSHCAFRSLFLRGCSTRSLFLSRSLASSVGRSLSRLNGVTVFFPWRRENEYAQNCKFRPFPSISFRRWNFTRRRFIFASFIVRFAFEKRSWLHFVRSHFWVDRWVGFLPSFLPSPRGEFFIGLNIFPFAILIILYRIYIYRIKVQTGVCSF